MSRTLGAINYGNNFEITSSIPLDARTVVSELNDLTTTSNNGFNASNVYVGLPVFVKEDNNLYVLINEDFTNISNWKKLGEGNQATSLEIRVLENLPTDPTTITPSLKDKSLVLVKDLAGVSGNLYKEYLFINNKFEFIGESKIDLTNYYTKTQTNDYISTQLNDKAQEIRDEITTSNNGFNTRITKNENDIKTLKEVDHSFNYFKAKSEAINESKAYTDTEIGKLHTVAKTGSYNDLIDKPTSFNVAEFNANDVETYWNS